MGLFNKNKSSSPKHNIIDVIKFDGPNDIMIWRHPNEDFNNNAQLIVSPSQEAIFVKGGQVLERFISGTYTLNSKNYPFIRSLIDLVTDGKSPFSCVVYYINNAISMGIDWGTDSPISVVDPIYGVPVDVRGYGDFSLRVENGQKLMTKLVGQTQGFSQEEVTSFFSNLIASRIRGVISSTMMEQGLSPIGIDAHLVEMSDAAAEKIRTIFEPYGMTVEHFVIGAITAPDLDSIKQKARDLQEHRMETNVFKEDKMRMAEAQRYENQALGVTEQEKWVGAAMGNLAENPGPIIGGASGMPFPGMISGNIVQPAAAGTTEMARMLLNRKPRQEPVNDFSGTMPGGDAAGFQQPVQESFEQRAKNVKFLLDNGMITQEQYQEKLTQLMNEI